MDSSSPKKRKRSATRSSSTARADAPINPRSHNPNTIKQFRAAGLSIDAPIPSQVYPGFPHRPIPPPPKQQEKEKQPHISNPASKFAHFYYSSDEDDSESGTSDSDGDSSKKDGDSLKLANDNGTTGRGARRVDFLLDIIHRTLMVGDIKEAKAAFTELRQTKIKGHAVGLCRHNYWMLGEKILAREGEDDMPPDYCQSSKEGNYDEIMYDWETKCRANSLRVVREYYEELIRQHPWTHQSESHPEIASSLDFYPAMFRYELEHVRDGHELALEWLEMKRKRDRKKHSGRDEEEDEDSDGEDEEEDEDRGCQKDGKGPIDWPKDGLRKHALTQLRDIAARMDSVLENTPYFRDYNLLSLRAKVAMCISDFSIPVRSSSHGAQAREEEDTDDLVERGIIAAEKERKKALSILLKLKNQQRNRLMDSVDKRLLRKLRREFDEFDD